MMPTATPSESSQILAQALELHRGGKLQEAVSLYRKSLPYLPMTEQNLALRAAIHNNMGAALRGLGDRQGAKEAFSQAIAFMPGYAEAQLNLGVALMEQQELELAVESFTRTLELRPNCAEAYNNMGAAFRKLKQLEQAENAYIQALVIKPEYLEARMNLALVYQEQEKLKEAADLLRAVLAKNPGYADAYLNLGTVLHQQGKYEDAIECFRKAQAFKPECAKAYINMAAVLKDQRQLEAAAEAARMGIQRMPDSPEAHLSLGTILHDQGNFPAATESYLRAISLRPDYVEALSDLGSVLLLQGDRTGLQYLEQALLLRPDYPAAHWNLASALLRLGEYAAAWPEHEWRWKWKMFASSQRNFHQPQWHGEPLHGETILLHAEQGLGDTLQFVRYASLVAERGGRVILEVQPPLQALLSNLSEIDQVISRGDSLPEFQWHCPLMSLPLAFATTLDTIPSSCPYIEIPQGQVDEKTGTGEFRVGLVWTGNPGHRSDLLRTIPGEKLTPLAALHGIKFIALQQDLSSPQKAEISTILPMKWYDFQDFSETAKVVANLDLVISVDTSVAHLAGAMGKPVWILLAQAADWRWLTNRNDSPWYPSARLFRQDTPGDWEGVIARIVQELKLVRLPE